MDKMSPQAMAAQAHDYLYPNAQERITRDLGHFADIEHSMPDVSFRYKRASLIDNLTSYLGAKNPFAKAAHPQDATVWLFDNIAFQSPYGGWQAEFLAAYFVKDSGKTESKVAASIAEKLGFGKDEDADKIIRARLQPLLDTILPAHTVDVNIGGSAHKLGPSSRDGLSSQVLPILGNHNVGETMISNAIGFPQSASMATTFAGPTGWAVISDIDDTIKKTLTSSPLGILSTTFAEEPQPIAGMPELYGYIWQRLQAPPTWYLSASPYNLYPFLHNFRNQYYPPGQLILRDASWMNLAGLLASLTQGTQTYKVNRMEKVHSWFPQRSFLCIGDSTQTDPESYAEIYKKYPGWVKAIFIRRVTDVDEVNEGGKNNPERFEKAFRDVPRHIWYVFQDPRELYQKVDEMIARGY